MTSQSGFLDIIVLDIAGPLILFCSASLLQVGRPLAKYELLNLAGGSFSQRTEYHCFRNLEARKMFTAKRDDFLLGHLMILIQCNKGAWRFSPLFIRASDNRSFLHSGVLI